VRHLIPDKSPATAFTEEERVAATACLEVLMNGRTEDRPAAKAQLRSLNTTGCSANDGKACNDLADQIAADNGPVADRDAARTKACNLGSGHACFVLATAMSGDPSTAPAARPLFAKACTGGEGQACEALAGMYETGMGSERQVFWAGWPLRQRQR